MLRLNRNTIIDKLSKLFRFYIVKIFSAKAKFRYSGLIGGCNSIVVYASSTFGKKFITAEHVEIFAKGNIEIGDNVFINAYSRIVSHKKISIGDHVTIAKFVSILDHDHKYQIINNNLTLDGYECEEIIIGNNVWISDKVTILKGVTIGDNVIVGCNSVVNKSIPCNSVVAGIPAKIIKKLT